MSERTSHASVTRMASMTQAYPGPRTIAYWVVTILVVFENASGFVWGVLHIEYLRVMLNHLGYPQYFGNVLGPWQLAAAVALMAPGLPLVKEWAYAGTFFNYWSGLVSHVAVGDGPSVWIAALVFAILTICSWVLRPADRRLPRPNAAAETTIRSWIVSIAVIGLMMVLARLNLPEPPKF